MPPRPTSLEAQEQTRRDAAILTLTLAIRSAVALQDSAEGPVMLILCVGDRSIEVRADRLPASITLVKGMAPATTLELSPPGLVGERSQSAMRWLLEGGPDGQA